MTTPYIVMGCPTTGGGQVISGNSMFQVEGIPIACVGDKATCLKHKTLATIITGDPYMQVLGKAVARVNDSLSCGCKLLPKQNLVVGATGPGNGSGSSNSSTSNFAQTNHLIYDEQIIAVDEQGALMPNISYYIETVEGEIYKGKTDSFGNCPRIATSKKSELKVWLGDDAEIKINETNQT